MANALNENALFSILIKTLPRTHTQSNKESEMWEREFLDFPLSIDYLCQRNFNWRWIVWRNFFISSVFKFRRLEGTFFVLSFFFRSFFFLQFFLSFSVLLLKKEFLKFHSYLFHKMKTNRFLGELLLGHLIALIFFSPFSQNERSRAHVCHPVSTEKSFDVNEKLFPWRINFINSR